MTIDELDREMQRISVPRAHPGAAKDALRNRLLAALQTSSIPGGRVTRCGPFVLTALAGLLLAGGSAPFWIPRLFSTFHWSENDWMAEAVPLEGLPERYHAEARQLWGGGQAQLLSRASLPDGSTCYQVEFVFRDGFRQRVNSGVPHDPRLRDELRQLVERGDGRVARRERLESGLVVYHNLYALSNGDVVGVGASFPPMSRARQTEAQRLIDEQTAAGEGMVVGRLAEQYTVEYRLPSGQPFTTVRSTPPAKMTPEREAEIFELKSRGGGRLVRHGITSFGDAYEVEYALSDGATFRVGHERPPMSDAQWDSLRTEVQALYRAGQCVRSSVTGVDDQPVAVLTFTVADGRQVEIPDVPASRGVWGLE